MSKKSPYKAIVTGGAGFIGSHIVDALYNDGYEILVIDNLSSGSRDNLKRFSSDSRVKLLEEDIRNLSSKDEIQNFQADVLVHAAAQISVSESMKDPKLDTDINVSGLVNLLSVLKDSNQNPYTIFISTGGAMYGDTSDLPTSESHPEVPSSFYGLAKKVSELYLDLWSKSYGLKYASLRLANVYGPRQNPHGEAGVIAIFHERLLDNKDIAVYGTGEQTRDYIYVEDVVGAVLAAIKSKIEGVFNIATSKETSVNDLIEVVFASLGVKAKIRYEEARAGEQQRSCLDSTKAQSSFGWASKVSFEEGIAKTSNWFKDKKS